MSINPWDGKFAELYQKHREKVLHDLADPIYYAGATAAAVVGVGTEVVIQHSEWIGRTVTSLSGTSLGLIGGVAIVSAVIFHKELKRAYDYRDYWKYTTDSSIGKWLHKTFGKSSYPGIGLQAWVDRAPTEAEKENRGGQKLVRLYWRNYHDINERLHYPSVLFGSMDIERFYRLGRQWGGNKLDFETRGSEAVQDARLTEIPAEIAQFSFLDTLHFQGNALTQLPSQLNQLTLITHIDLSNNAFSEFPLVITEITSLYVLKISNNQIETLPPEIGRLTNLYMLSLESNRLSSLPAELFTLSGDQQVLMPDVFVPQRTQVYLSNNPFSPNLLDNLMLRTRASNYRGPSIWVTASSQGLIQSSHDLDYLLERLCQSAGMELLKLKDLIATASDKAKLFQWLERLSTIGDYHTDKRQSLASLIYFAIQKAENDLTFRNAFWMCIDQAYTTCGDKMALSVLMMDVQYQINTAFEEKNLKTLAYLIGHGRWAIWELVKIASNKVEEMKKHGAMIDDVEIYLGYPIKLKQSLRLAFNLDSMSYFNLSGLVSKDLDTAEEFVKLSLTDKEAYLQILAQDDTWLAALEQCQSEKFNALLKARNETEDPPEAAQAAFISGVCALTCSILDEKGWPPLI